MYADIIIDIAHQAVDRIFEYRIPKEWEREAAVGKTVRVPFGNGNSSRSGYIVGLKETPDFAPELIKDVLEIRENELSTHRRFIELAAWMREEYGSTMIQALKTVLPVQEKTEREESRMVKLLLCKEDADKTLETYERKHYHAKARILGRLIKQGEVSYSDLRKTEKITLSTIHSMEKEGVLCMECDGHLRNPVKNVVNTHAVHRLNETQQEIYDDFCREYDQGIRKTYLLHGVTGSGKTEVYLALIRKVIEDGKQVIVLIPEISLTFQTINRFYAYFGDRVSFVNSRLSKGEKYDQFVRAQNGEIDVMIGPRSALFTPFSNLGLIIIDEEHEGAYKSELSPKFHARDTAEKLASVCRASLILGSATPSLESYTKALKGEYRLWTMTERANRSALPEVSIVDLRKELEEGNRSMFSRELRGAMEDRLNKKEQIMLFLNRRGFAGFLSCRQCGHVLKCPHCDISLTYHRGGRMNCHYCGYSRAVPKLCPECGSRHIAAFGTGTQKVEAALYREFPDARIMRMDFDTTRKKESYDQMLAAFAKGEADILVGTQMIVKGHDFSNVTLMGILAADLSLHSGDFRSGERTFQLVTQAAGRAGRGGRKGKVILQTYQPDHYAVITAGRQNYQEFYEQEMMFRRMLRYPPVCDMLVIFCTSKSQEEGMKALDGIAGMLKQKFYREAAAIIGPSEGAFPKINDIYRRVLYIKTNSPKLIKQMRDAVELHMKQNEIYKKVHVYFDKNPMGIY